MSIGDYFIVALMLATFGVLVAGIALMAAGGNNNTKYGNKLMFSRVGLQGLTLLLLAFMWMLGTN